MIYTTPMPCSDSSSSISIKVDHDERFISYEYAKITCGREITGGTEYAKYLKGKTLDDILAISFQQALTDLKIPAEEDQYILYLEWDVLRSAIGLYLGIENPEIDTGRCMITSIETTEEGIEFAEVILPPKEMPKILPCSIANDSMKE